LSTARRRPEGRHRRGEPRPRARPHPGPPPGAVRLRPVDGDPRPARVDGEPGPTPVRVVGVVALARVRDRSAGRPGPRRARVPGRALAGAAGPAGLPDLSGEGPRRRVAVGRDVPRQGGAVVNTTKGGPMTKTVTPARDALDNEVQAAAATALSPWEGDP